MKFTAQGNFELQACRQRLIYPTINQSLFFEPSALDKMQCVLFCILWQWHVKRVIPRGTHFPSSLEINYFIILLKHPVPFSPNFSISFKDLLLKLNCKNGLFWDLFYFFETTETLYIWRSMYMSLTFIQSLQNPDPSSND